MLKTIIIGVSGGIPLYKSCEIVRALKNRGFDVWVVMTASAQKFISPLTFRTLSGNPVITDLFDENLKDLPVPHIALRDKADLVLVCPATANIVAKTAHGIADDALSTFLLSVNCPVFFAPAMNPTMWNNKIVQSNLTKIKEAGINIIAPTDGPVVCGDSGVGRLASIETILEMITSPPPAEVDLAEINILVTAGATRETIDPIRFISNRSSGKMGYAIASAAKKRGANVTLISGPTNLKPPKDVNFVQVVTAEEMRTAVNTHKKEARVIIMTAAIADYRPRFAYMQKLQKREGIFNLELTRTTDILEELGKNKNGSYLVGFAAESTNMLENAKEKMERKNLDMIVANDVSAFEEDHSEATVIIRSGDVDQLPRQSKASLANAILDKIIKY